MPISSTFLSYLEIGDTSTAKKLWTKTQNDTEQRKALIEAQDAEGYNCFLIASRNGDHQSLEWLLSLNDDRKDEAAEDERNVMTSNKKTGETPLLICVSHDIRKKVDGEKELTKKEKESYFQCIKLIMATVSPQNKDDLLKERDKKRNFNSIAWCCWNGNIETARFLLDQASDALKQKLMAHFEDDHPYFVDAIRGRNVELIRLIHTEYEKATKHHKEVVDLNEKEEALEAQKQLISRMQSTAQGRGAERGAADAVKKQNDLQKEVDMAKIALYMKIEKELLRGTVALENAFSCGVMEVAKWILNDLIGHPKRRMKFLNQTIVKCKKGRKTEESAQDIINSILEKDLNSINDQKAIDKVRNIFQFLMERDPVDINGVRLILEKLNTNKKIKKKWFKSMNYLEYAADQRPKLMEELLRYLDTYYEPLLEQNVLIAAIEKHSVSVVELLFSRVQDQNTVDAMINTRDITKNALISCVKQNDARLMELLCDNHSDIEPILGDSFRSCLKSGNVDSVKFLLNQTADKSDLLNKTDEYGRTALMFALQSGSSRCLSLIMEQLEDDYKNYMTRLETESTDEKKDEVIEAKFDDSEEMIHPMYSRKDNRGDNILHYLFADPNQSANDKQMDVLMNVLSSERLRELLDERNLSEESPLHRLVCVL